MRSSVGQLGPVLSICLCFVFVGCAGDDDDSTSAAGGVGAGGGIGGGAGDEPGGAGNAGAAGTPSCRTRYELTSYDGDTAGLCAPEVSTRCDCGDVALSFTVECPPGSSPGDDDCVTMSAFCSLHEPIAECGWTVCNSCPEQETSIPCAADDDGGDQKCVKRIADRLFCD